jgi:hypothetical protein
MANYNIVVKSIVRTSSGFTGTFSLADNEFVVSTDGGRTMNRAAATVHSGIETIVYDGTLRPKISGTQGQRKDALAPAQIGEQSVHVMWTQGHRGAVSAAFMAVWGEVGAALEVGQSAEVNKTNPKGGRSGGSSAVVTPVVNNDKVNELEAMIKAQAEQMKMLMDMLAKQNS